MMDLNSLNDKLHALFAAQIDENECFGGAAAVLLHGEPIFNETFGDTRFNGRSIFRLASVTKLFTAAAVMKLCEEGKLALDAPVSTYLPAYASLPLGQMTEDGRILNAGMPARQITVHDLLAHTAGLGADPLGNREYELIPAEIKTSLESVTDYYAAHLHLAFEPGSRAAYSGFAAYDVLARIIELQSGQSFNDYLQSAICAPLDLCDTTFQPSDEQYARLVPMHKRVSGEAIEINFRGNLFRSVPRTYEMAGASLISSMRDVIRMCQMLRGGGLYNGRRILSAQSVKAMCAPQLPDGLSGLQKGENNGFGCFMITGEHRLPRGSIFTHGAYGTHILCLPKADLIGIFLKNSFYDMSITSRSTMAFEEILKKF
ncbi:MAG: beta-lactamase family protein [Clostridia bacterium]|nr:beta-lactamase family protein [Clostridia bacterium]